MNEIHRTFLDEKESKLPNDTLPRMPAEYLYGHGMKEFWNKDASLASYRAFYDKLIDQAGPEIAETIKLQINSHISENNKLLLTAIGGGDFYVERRYINLLLDAGINIPLVRPHEIEYEDILAQSKRLRNDLPDTTEISPLHGDFSDLNIAHPPGHESIEQYTGLTTIVGAALSNQRDPETWIKQLSEQLPENDLVLCDFGLPAANPSVEDGRYKSPNGCTSPIEEQWFTNAFVGYLVETRTAPGPIGEVSIRRQIEPLPDNIGYSIVIVGEETKEDGSTKSMELHRYTRFDPSYLGELFKKHGFDTVNSWTVGYGAMLFKKMNSKDSDSNSRQS